MLNTTRASQGYETDTCDILAGNRGTIGVVTPLFTDGAHTVKRSLDSLLLDNTIVAFGK
jgi:hypothetical protein